MTCRQIVLVIVAASATCLHAQQTYGPTVTGSLGLITLRSAQTLPAATVSGGMYFNMYDREGYTQRGQNADRSLSYDANMWTLGASFGLKEQVEIDTSLSFESLYDASERAGVIGGRYFQDSFSASGWGPLEVGAKWRLLSDESFRRGVAVETRMTIPISHNVIAGASVGYELRVDAMQPNWILNLAYRDRGDSNIAANRREATIGIGFAHSLNERLDVLTEVVAERAFEGNRRPPTALDVTVGTRYWLGSGRWSVGGGVRVNAAMATHGFRNSSPVGAVVGVSVSPTFFATQ